MAELALRCFKSERGHPARGLEQLMPKYLQAVRVNPFSGRVLVNRPVGAGWLLYGVGEDGADDGGKPVGQGLGAKSDILYDSPY